MPGAQQILADTPEGIEHALQLYADAAAAESAARCDKEFAKLVLDGLPAGTNGQPRRYGRWEVSRGRPGQILDQSSARAALEDAGLDVPTMPTAGRLRVTAAATKETT